MTNRNTIIAVIVLSAGHSARAGSIFFAPKQARKLAGRDHPERSRRPREAAAGTERPAVGPPLAPPSCRRRPQCLRRAVTSRQQRQTAVAEEKRIRINTPRLHGSLSLTGLRFDDITLADFHETPDPHSPEITLLSPPDAPKPYFIEQGWIASDAAVKLPTAATVWTVDHPDAQLTDTTPVVAHWDNGEGLRFTHHHPASTRISCSPSRRPSRTPTDKPVTCCIRTAWSRASTRRRRPAITSCMKKVRWACSTARSRR